MRAALLLLALVALPARASAPTVTLVIKAVIFRPDIKDVFSVIVKGTDEDGNQVMTPLVAPTIGVKVEGGVVPDDSVLLCRSAGKVIECRFNGR